MKNFIKLFFITLCIFLPLFANADGIAQCGFDIEPHIVIENVSKNSAEVLAVQTKKNESSIAAPNFGNFELSAIQDRRNTQSSASFDKTGAQFRLLQQIFTDKYNKLYYSTSHKISSYLKNEICTRAP